MLRLDTARCLLLWEFYSPRPANGKIAHRYDAAPRCQRLSIVVSALPVNRCGTHLSPRRGLLACPAHRGMPPMSPTAYERKTVAQRRSSTSNYAAPSGLRDRKAPKDSQQPCFTPKGRCYLSNSLMAATVRLSQSWADLYRHRPLFTLFSGVRYGLVGGTRGGQRGPS
jgi:hypothetical protein